MTALRGQVLPTPAPLGEVRMVSHSLVCGERIYTVRYRRSKRIAAVVTYGPFADAPQEEKWSSTHINSDPHAWHCIHCLNAIDCAHVEHVIHSLSAEPFHAPDAEQTGFVLNAEQSAWLLDTLHYPPEPTEALRRAWADYQAFSRRPHLLIDEADSVHEGPS